MLGSATLASLALVVPAVLSRHDAPTADNPETQRWYASLRKPGFNPPRAVFPVVWTLLDGLLAISGYRVARKQATPQRRSALVLWTANIAAIAGWSKLFFGRRALGASALASGAMVPLGAAYVAASARVDRPAAVQAAPYVGWLLFATLLSTTIWMLNREK